MKMSELPGAIYRIDDGIPIPPERVCNNEMIYATARVLEVGQSFEIPKQRSGLVGNLARATGFTFTQRTIGDKMRIWRIK